MCGISGIFHPRSHLEDSLSVVKRMTRQLIHRGPDEEGFFQSPKVTLGMRRLKVIDLETGTQPIFNEDQTISVVCNGEIYRYEQIRKKLEKLNHRFSTKSDVEVLVHLYEQFDLDFLNHCDGMFSFALWDKKKGRLIVARDRFGIKPLFYSEQNNGDLIFSSEIPSLLKHPQISKEWDLIALDEYFALSYIPQPRTIYRAIRKLAPGHLLIASEKGIEHRSYWNPFHHSSSLDKKTTLDQLDTALNDSVQTMMRADVPMGMFLSGGLDSGTVLYYMAKHASKPIETFSVRFHEKSCDEGEYAKATAKLFSTNHHELWIPPSSLEDLPNMLKSFGEPFADPALVPGYSMAQLAKKNVVVVLSGDGGDEIFGGYRSYRASLLARKLSFLPNTCLRCIATLSHYLSSSLKSSAIIHQANKFLQGASLAFNKDQHAYWKIISTDEERRSLYSPDFLTQIGDHPKDSRLFSMWNHLFDQKHDDALWPYQCLDIQTYLTDNNLAKVDRTSMAHSLEVRIPFLDLGVFQSASQLSLPMRIHRGQTKVALRKLMQNRLPSHVLSLKKKGFSVPLAEWFRKESKAWLKSQLDPKMLAKTSLFSLYTVNDLIDQHLSGFMNRERILWSLVCFMEWWRQDGN
jgi:asparagine synthase (glutamine-hydrolysing)